ncbi:dnaJ subfamily A member 2-like protein [Aphelenchoides avenae]|nr:dnaJ subfamily A member 2-like protein [Aphelenchus avenae]
MATAPGEVVQPECIRGVLGEGMPIPSSLEKGNLYVLFDVKFPSNHFLADESDYKKLEALLPPRPKADVPPKHGDVEEVTLSEFDERRYERTGGGRREAYHDDDDDSDDEMGGGHPGGSQHVQCAQQ